MTTIDMLLVQAVHRDRERAAGNYRLAQLARAARRDARRAAAAQPPLSAVQEPAPRPRRAENDLWLHEALSA